MGNVINTFAAKPIEPFDSSLAAPRSAYSLIWDVVSTILFPIGAARALHYGLKRVACKLVLASSQKKTSQEVKKKFDQFWFGEICEENLVMRTAFDAHRIKIKTADGVMLSAVLYKSTMKPDSDVPTVICCNMNAVFQEGCPFQNLMAQSVLEGTPANFITFDYRSVGDSEGVFCSEEDLVRDASAIVQYVQQEVKTKNENIHFFGWSIGGSVAIKTKALFSGLGKIIIDRSFSSLGELVKRHCPYLLKFIGYLIAWILKKLDLAFDSASSFKSEWNVREPAREKTAMVFSHEDDKVVKGADLQVGDLQVLKEEEEFSGTLSPKLHHCYTLGHYFVPSAAPMNALKKANRFLLQRENFDTRDMTYSFYEKIEEAGKKLAQPGKEAAAILNSAIRNFVELLHVPAKISDEQLISNMPYQPEQGGLDQIVAQKYKEFLEAKDFYVKHKVDSN